MRKVLVVAYYFPPQGGAGVQRTLKFVKYLPEFGWQPVVLTTKHAGKLQDPSLVSEIPENVKIYRTPVLLLPSALPWRVRRFITQWLLLVDEQLGWFPFAVHTGQRIIREEAFSLMYTTSAPYTDHLIGLQLKRQTGLPWFADFRDPWADNFSAAYATRWHHQQIHKLERLVFQTADRIGVTSERQREFYIHKYGALIGTKILTITNGYDAEDLIALTPQKQCDPTRFTLTYVGSLYGKRQTAQYFFQGLKRALDAGDIPAASIKIYFVGNIGQETLQLVEKLNLSDVVSLKGYASHRESIRFLISADALLLILGQGPHSELVIPSKVFEYLPTQRPILALVPPGATRDLLYEAGFERTVAPEDIENIAVNLTALYCSWKTGELDARLDATVIRNYERRTLTAKLVDAFNEIQD